MKPMIPALWAEIPNGRRFYDEGLDQVLTKRDDTHAFRMLYTLQVESTSPVMDEYMEVVGPYAPDRWLRVFPQRYIYDGQRRVEIDECCNGSVIREETIRYNAFTNAIDGGEIVYAVLKCKECGTVLHTIIEDKRNNDHERSEQNNAGGTTPVRPGSSEADGQYRPDVG